MLEITVSRSAEGLLNECASRGLVVKLDTVVKKKPGGRHWHLGYPGRPGVLEMTDSAGQVSLRVLPTRDGGWAAALALELAGAKRPRKAKRGKR